MEKNVEIFYLVGVDLISCFTYGYGLKIPF